MENLRFRPKLQSLERRETPSGTGTDPGNGGNTSAPLPEIIIEPEIKIIIVPPPH
jgi:hypothetical protein